jgi:hypothetical protein
MAIPDITSVIVIDPSPSAVARRAADSAAGRTSPRKAPATRRRTPICTPDPASATAAVARVNPMIPVNTVLAVPSRRLTAPASIPPSSIPRNAMLPIVPAPARSTPSGSSAMSAGMALLNSRRSYPSTIMIAVQVTTTRQSVVARSPAGLPAAVSTAAVPLPRLSM